METTTILIATVSHLQALNKLSDRQFALRLKIDPGQWSRIKRELCPPGMKFLNALIREFPEAKLAVYQFIAGDDVEEQGVSPKPVQANNQ